MSYKYTLLNLQPNREIKHFLFYQTLGDSGPPFRCSPTNNPQVAYLNFSEENRRHFYGI